MLHTADYPKIFSAASLQAKLSPLPSGESLPQMPRLFGGEQPRRGRYISGSIG
jgi:hypothetical protein